MKDKEKAELGGYSCSPLAELYRHLAFELNDGGQGDFLSGWQCANPLADAFIEGVKERASTLNHGRYTYFDERSDLASSILEHHRLVDTRPPASVVFGSGTTALLTSLVAFLRDLGIRRVFCVSPLFLALRLALARFQISVTPVCSLQPFEPGFTMALPKQHRAVLLLTDPIWFAGTSMPVEVIHAIRDWQDETEALVFVDGSLQYMHWDGHRFEHTSCLDPERTLRLICPAKQLAVHGYRFSYMLLPAKWRQPFSWVYTNTIGPASVDSIAFGVEAISAVVSAELPKRIMEAAFTRHRILRQQKAISSTIEPNCGYFVFERILRTLPPNTLLLGPEYFELVGFDGYAKINLLSPNLNLLSPEAGNAF